jgi:hypothetical protein
MYSLACSLLLSRQSTLIQDDDLILAQNRRHGDRCKASSGNKINSSGKARAFSVDHSRQIVSKS